MCLNIGHDKLIYKVTSSDVAFFNTNKPKQILLKNNFCFFICKFSEMTFANTFALGMMKIWDWKYGARYLQCQLFLWK